MNINLHIDRIILDGIDLAPSDDRLLQQIVSRELATRFSREGFGASHRNVGEFGSISGGTIHFDAAGTASLGQKLAHGIHRGLGVAQSSATRNTGGPN